MSNCNCGYDIGDPRVACHATNCTEVQIQKLKAANHWRAIEEEKLRKRIAGLEAILRRVQASAARGYIADKLRADIQTALLGVGDNE